MFSLLTGYCDPPAGVELAEGMHFNPYFPGAQTGMARALFSEMIEYDDGMLFSLCAYSVKCCLRIIFLPKLKVRNRISAELIQTFTESCLQEYRSHVSVKQLGVLRRHVVWLLQY